MEELVRVQVQQPPQVAAAQRQDHRVVGAQTALAALPSVDARPLAAQEHATMQPGAPGVVHEFERMVFRERALIQLVGIVKKAGCQVVGHKVLSIACPRHKESTLVVPQFVFVMDSPSHPPVIHVNKATQLAVKQALEAASAQRDGVLRPWRPTTSSRWLHTAERDDGKWGGGRFARRAVSSDWVDGNGDNGRFRRRAVSADWGNAEAAAGVAAGHQKDVGIAVRAESRAVVTERPVGVAVARLVADARVDKVVAQAPLEAEAMGSTAPPGWRPGLWWPGTVLRQHDDHIPLGSMAEERWSAGGCCSSHHG